MRLPQRTRWALAGLSALGLLAMSAPAMAATPPLTYTVTVTGSWTGTWTVGPGHSSYRASRAPVPYDKAWTAEGDITLTFPPLPAGDQYWDSGSMNNPGLYSNAWCGQQGAAWPQYAIPVTGGTYSEPLSTIWGTMWPMTSTPAACVIAISPPEIADAQGHTTSAQFGGVYLSLPVSVDQPPQPKPKPSTPPVHSGGSGGSGSSGQGGSTGGGTTQPHAPINPPHQSTTTGTPGNTPPSQSAVPQPGQTAHPAPGTTTPTPSRQHGKGVLGHHQPKRREGKKIKSRPVHPAHGTSKSQPIATGPTQGQHPQSRAPSHFAGFPWWLLLLLLLAAATLIGWLMRHRQRRRMQVVEEAKEAGEGQKDEEGQEGHESPEDEE